MPCFYLVVIILKELADGGEYFYAYYKSEQKEVLEGEGIFPPTFSGHMGCIWVPFSALSQVSPCFALAVFTILPQYCKTHNPMEVCDIQRHTELGH